MNSKKTGRPEKNATQVPQTAIKDVSTFGEAPSYYANNAEVKMSPWDIRFSLGEIQGLKEGKLLVKNLAIVHMSPIHAKAFSAILAKKIIQYEEKVGPIPTPPTAEEPK